ncbi:NUDIX domain-containing protein [Streptomyces sp. NPDC059371]|uniref:NUDIX domain-containing protein n=1 Tax=Streptomyces sp. NPDC059371 TaxID=3346812 RepID=UPI0036B301F1
MLHIGHRATGQLLPPGGHVEAGDHTFMAAAVREVCEEAGLRPGDLCLTPQFLDEPIDVDVHDIDANPDTGEAAHQHFDIRFAFYLTAEQPPALALQDERSPRPSGSRTPTCAPPHCGPSSSVPSRTAWTAPGARQRHRPDPRRSWPLPPSPTR